MASTALVILLVTSIAPPITLGMLWGIVALGILVEVLQDLISNFLCKMGWDQIQMLLEV